MVILLVDMFVFRRGVMFATSRIIHRMNAAGSIFRTGMNLHT